MIRPDEQVVRAFAHIKQNVPAAAGWIIEQYRTELERLPHAAQNISIAQGRCQVLKEISELLTNSPELAAEAREG